MMTRLRLALTLALAPLVAAPLVAAPLAAQSPWDHVPAFPTACYQSDDAFSANVARAIDSLDAMIATQSETNAAIKARLDDMDMMVKQQKMMAFMQKDPAAAQKFMQAVTASQTMGEGSQDVSAKREALKQQRAQIQAQLDADKAKYHSLRPQFRQAGMSAGELVRAKAVELQHNAEYEQVCAKWWGASSHPYAAYFADLKRHLIEEHVRWYVEDAKNLTMQFEVFGIPHAAYKPTAELEAVKEYLAEVLQFYEQRLSERMVVR